MILHCNNQIWHCRAPIRVQTSSRKKNKQDLNAATSRWCLAAQFSPLLAPECYETPPFWMLARNFMTTTRPTIKTTRFLVKTTRLTFVTGDSPARSCRGQLSKRSSNCYTFTSFHIQNTRVYPVYLSLSHRTSHKI